MAAGCIFTDGKYILAALQGGNENEKEFISGFGGKSLENEGKIDTAIRETLEELFHVENIPHEIVRAISIESMPQKYISNNGYDILVYRFDDLYDWGLILSGFAFQSPLYDIIPLTVPEFLFKRKCVDGAEIKQLCLLPLQNDLTIHANFVEDIRFVIGKIEGGP